MTVPALQLADVCESCRQQPGTRWVIGGDGEPPFLVCPGCAPTPMSASAPPPSGTVPPSVPAGRRPTVHPAGLVVLAASAGGAGLAGITVGGPAGTVLVYCAFAGAAGVAVLRALGYAR